MPRKELTRFSVANVPSLLNAESHLPKRARYPVVDFHNHLFAAMDGGDLVQVMDEVGVAVFNNVSGNAVLPYVDNAYTIQRVDFSDFANNHIERFPGRFTAFTMADFAQWQDFVLIKTNDFAEACIQRLDADVALGARGLKITKELGLRFVDATGSLVRIDDCRLDPIWRHAEKTHLPVLMHVSDPKGFFLPMDQNNEHYQTLQEFPSWSFYGSRFSKAELLEQRNTVIARFPQIAFILPHVANLPEDLSSVAQLLDAFPNVHIDFSARIDELGRQPYRSRDFFIAYQDRILFGTDMPVSADVYRCYFRFLETRYEYFSYPDYIGRWGRCRWRIYGLHLPDHVLQKVYYQNAQRLLPGIRL